MPKIHVKIGMLGRAIYDNGHELPSEAARITQEQKEITLHLPLSASPTLPGAQA